MSKSSVETIRSRLGQISIIIEEENLDHGDGGSFARTVRFKYS
jgi:hypothetical protein